LLCALNSFFSGHRAGLGIKGALSPRAHIGVIWVQQLLSRQRPRRWPEHRVVLPRKFLKTLRYRFVWKSREIGLLREQLGVQDGDLAYLSPHSTKEEATAALTIENIEHPQIAARDAELRRLVDSERTDRRCPISASESRR